MKCWGAASESVHAWLAGVETGRAAIEGDVGGAAAVEVMGGGGGGMVRGGMSERHVRWANRTLGRMSDADVARVINNFNSQPPEPDTIDAVWCTDAEDASEDATTQLHNGCKIYVFPNSRYVKDSSLWGVVWGPCEVCGASREKVTKQWVDELDKHVWVCSVTCKNCLHVTAELQDAVEEVKVVETPEKEAEEDTSEEDDFIGFGYGGAVRTRADMPEWYRRVFKGHKDNASVLQNFKDNDVGDQAISRTLATKHVCKICKKTYSSSVASKKYSGTIWTNLRAHASRDHADIADIRAELHEWTSKPSIKDQQHIAFEQLRAAEPVSGFVWKPIASREPKEERKEEPKRRKIAKKYYPIFAN